MFEPVIFISMWVIPLLVIVGGLVYGVTVATRKRRGFVEEDPGVGTVRRLYFYVVSFIALMVGANGLALAAAYVIEVLFGGDVLDPSRTVLATGLAMAIVGMPLWALHWRIVLRLVRELPVETRSPIRKCYVYVVMAASVFLVIAGLVQVLQWAFGAESFTGWPWAAAAVFGAVWAYHWRTEEAEGQPTPETLAVRRLYLYLTAAATLIMGATGLAQVIHVVLLEGYESLVSTTVLHPSGAGLWREPIREDLALGLVGAVMWAVHWLYLARGDFTSVLRQLYFYLFAILGGIVTVMASLGIILYITLEWAIGVPEATTASLHFRSLPGALASLGIGLGIFVYHWVAAGWEAGSPAPALQRVRRSYSYVAAALGLGALAFAIGTVVSAAIETLAESGGEIIVDTDLWRNHMALGITLAILGLPLWGRYWTSVQRQLRTGDAAARTSIARRIFIFGVLGAGMLALLGGASHLVYVFLRELMEGDLSKVLRDANESLGVLVAAAVFLPYHWMVYRADRRVTGEEGEPEEEKRPIKTVTALVGEYGRDFLQRLETALGYDVGSLRWVDPDAGMPVLSDADYKDLARRIGEATGPNVLVIPGKTEVRVLSYR